MAAFVAEFGEPRSQEWALALPTSTALGRLSALHAELDEALDAVRSDLAAGDFGDEMLREVERIKGEASAHRLTAVEASALLLRADIQMKARRFEAASEAAHAALNLPRDPHRDLTTGRDAVDKIINAAIAMKDFAALSDACGEAIALIERHRYNISAPYAQSAFLRDRARYYTMGMDAAFRQDDFDSLLQRADAFKAAGSLRNIGPPSDVSPGELEVRFRLLTEQI